jgi:hypothetical protein
MRTEESLMLEEHMLINEVRDHYRLIYDWHKENGVREYSKRYEGKATPDNEWSQKYFSLLECMPLPEDADLESIERVAQAVRCGCMEWSYWVEAKPQLPLSKIAAHILKTLDWLENHDEEKTVREKLTQLRNTGEEASTPTCVQITVPKSGGHDTTAYSRYAELAYHDAIAPLDRENLGGMVVLADTNLEHELGHACADQTVNATVISFRNASALHLVEDMERGTLVSLVKSGDIVVESVKIGIGG